MNVLNIYSFSKEHYKNQHVFEYFTKYYLSPSPTLLWQWVEQTKALVALRKALPWIVELKEGKRQSYERSTTAVLHLLASPLVQRVSGVFNTGTPENSQLFTWYISMAMNIKHLWCYVLDISLSWLKCVCLRRNACKPHREECVTAQTSRGRHVPCWCEIDSTKLGIHCTKFFLLSNLDASNQSLTHTVHHWDVHTVRRDVAHDWDAQTVRGRRAAHSTGLFCEHCFLPPSS